MTCIAEDFDRSDVADNIISAVIRKTNNVPISVLPRSEGLLMAIMRN
jgi:hypothetical protein